MRRTRSRYEGKKVAQSQSMAELLLECTRQCGDLSAARRMCGMTAGDLKVVLAQDPELQGKLDKAVEEGQGNRVRQALKLIKAAQDVSLACEDWEGMVEIAKLLAPDLLVEPHERARARAKAEEGPKTNLGLQINLGMSELSDRLQQSLKGKNTTSCTFDHESVSKVQELEAVLLGD